MIRVALADDNSEMRTALRLLLGLFKDIELVYEASNGQEAVDCVKRLRPDVLVMDIHMPVLDGFEATQQIADLSVSTSVILISTDIGSYVIKRAAAAGAKSFVSKDDLARLLLPAIESVYQGKTYFVE